MIDVLHVISGLGTGGAETMLVQFAARLRARGLSQHVVSLSGHDALAADLRMAGVDVTMLNASSLTSVPGAIAALRRTVNRLRPRILQGWMYHGNIAATVAHYLSAGRRDRRLFWNLRASNMDAQRYGRVIWLSGRLSQLPELVVANSETGVEFHRQHSFRPKRVIVIDNGVDTGKFRPDPAARQRVRHELGISDEAIVVIHVARVDPMKDHATFLAAMAQLPALTGLLVGEGTRELSPPPNVRALGRRRDTDALYAGADIVASASAFGEGFSNVIAEGMSAGLVPVATDVGDARRIVGDVGSIVAPGDPQAFAVALRDVAALPEAERRRRGLAARARIVANFTLDRAVDAFARLYADA
jgi:glycosyltransferase involved in cell wall biosynthesis